MLDQLLEWCSERETGTPRAFREAYDWLAGTRGVTGRADAGLALMRLAELAHVEVDYQSNRWAIAPPVVVVIEESGGLAILAGARPRLLMRRLWALEEDDDPTIRHLSPYVYPEIRKAADPTTTPATILLSHRSDEILHQVCDTLGILFEHGVSDQMARVLPSLDDYLGVGSVPASPPGFEPRRMQLQDKVSFQPAASDREAGAYEYVRYGPPRYIFNDGASLFQADRRIVVYAELRRIGTNVLLYQRSAQRMLVPGTCPLPLLHARCAVLRTGQLPTFTRNVDGVAQGRPVNVYENIPESLFLRIAERLGQAPSFL